MALSAQSVQYLNSLPFLREVDPSSGPEGPNGVSAYTLIPSSGYFNDHRFPHEVAEDLKNQDFDTTTVDGIEYYRVPETDSSNLPGRLSEYAQRTGVAELQNPPGGGVNRVAETLEKTSAATADPDGVKEFVSSNDSFEEARKKKSAENARIERQVTDSSTRKSAPAPKSAPKASSKE